MFEIFDEYCWTKTKQVLTKNQHHIPGLGNFTHWNISTASDPSPIHIHSNIIEIHCMVKGTRFTQIEKNGQIIRYTVTGNQTMIVFPFELHSNGSGPMDPCEFYAFQIDVSDPDHLLGLNPDYSRALYNSLLGLKHRQLSLNNTHLRLLRTAFTFFSDQDPDKTRIGTQFLTAFLFTLQYLEPVRTESTTELSENVKAALTYIEDNINRPLRLEEIAEVSGYSLSRFKVRFKEQLGITPAEYITLEKLRLAKKLLIGSRTRVTDIAYQLGFSSSNYFSSVFRKYNFCTPREYRKLHSEKEV